jgi:hypothetical protein
MMPLEAVVIGRDLALVLLMAEAIVLAVPLVIVPFFAIKYLRRFKPPVRSVLRQIRQTTGQVEKATKIVSSMAVQPFLWAAAATEGLKGALRYLAKRR